MKELIKAQSLYIDYLEKELKEVSPISLRNPELKAYKKNVEELTGKIGLLFPKWIPISAMPVINGMYITYCTYCGVGIHQLKGKEWIRHVDGNMQCEGNITHWARGEAPDDDNSETVLIPKSEKTIPFSRF